MSDLVWHEEALFEAEEATVWYRERDSRVAAAFVAAIEHAAAAITEAPSRWPSHTHGTRRYLVPRFPFSVVYRTRGEVVQVVAVSHHRRRPGYWRGR